MVVGVAPAATSDLRTRGGPDHELRRWGAVTIPGRSFVFHPAITPFGERAIHLVFDGHIRWTSVKGNACRIKRRYSVALYVLDGV